MKPLKIEPKDIAIVFEISATQLESVVDFIEKMKPFSDKILIDSAEVLKDVEDFMVVSKDILEHPLVKGK
jgi:hypothetical protein